MSVTFSRFQDELLVAAFDLSESTGQEMVETGDIFKKYPISMKANWTMRALFDFAERGLAKNTFTHDSETEQSIWLTAAGIREAERLSDHGVVVFNIDDFDESDDDDTLSIQSVSSADWTGITSRVSEQDLIAVRGKAAALESAIRQSELDPETRENAISRVEGVVKLLEAPDPPWKEVVEILNSKYTNSILVVTNLIQFILSFTK